MQLADVFILYICFIGIFYMYHGYIDKEYGFTSPKRGDITLFATIIISVYKNSGTSELEMVFLFLALTLSLGINLRRSKRSFINYKDEQHLAESLKAIMTFRGYSCDIEGDEDKLVIDIDELFKEVQIEPDVKNGDVRYCYVTYKHLPLQEVIAINDELKQQLSLYYSEQLEQRLPVGYLARVYNSMFAIACFGVAYYLYIYEYDTVRTHIDNLVSFIQGIV